MNPDPAYADEVTFFDSQPISGRVISINEVAGLMTCLDTITTFIEHQKECNKTRVAASRQQAEEIVRLRGQVFWLWVGLFLCLVLIMVLIGQLQ